MLDGRGHFIGRSDGWFVDNSVLKQCLRIKRAYPTKSNLTKPFVTVAS